jgi:hypothetical protein
MAEGKEEWTPLFRASVRGHALNGAGAGLADGPGADPSAFVLARFRARAFSCSRVSVLAFPARFPARARAHSLAICAPPPRRANTCPGWQVELAGTLEGLRELTAKRFPGAFAGSRDGDEHSLEQTAAHCYYVERAEEVLQGASLVSRCVACALAPPALTPRRHSDPPQPFCSATASRAGPSSTSAVTASTGAFARCSVRGCVSGAKLRCDAARRGAARRAAPLLG